MADGQGRGGGVLQNALALRISPGRGNARPVSALASTAGRQPTLLSSPQPPMRLITLLLALLVAATAAQPLPQPPREAVRATLDALAAAARSPALAPAPAVAARHAPKPPTAPTVVGGESAPGASSSRVATRDDEPVIFLSPGDRPMAPGKPVFAEDAGRLPSGATAQRVVVVVDTDGVAPKRESPAAAAAAAGADVDCGACADLCSAAGLRAAAPGSTPAPRPRRALADVGTKSVAAGSAGDDAALSAAAHPAAVAKAARCGCTCVGV